MAAINAFAGKLAMVTGAGDGIGEMLAREFSKAGMRVCVQDIRGDAAARVADEIGNGAFPLVFDVSDHDAAFSAAETLSNLGPLSLLWVNAGVGVGSALLTGKQKAVEWALDVNVRGVIWTAQAFVPLMTDTTGPRHVGFTASTAAPSQTSSPWATTEFNCSSAGSSWWPSSSAFFTRRAFRSSESIWPSVWGCSRECSASFPTWAAPLRSSQAPRWPF